jgi:hypothetical protein
LKPSERLSPPRRPRRSNLPVFAVALLGLGLFVLARVGVTVLPFDQHHILTQFLGLALVLGALPQWQ